MLRSSSPTKFLLAWAANAGASFIRAVPVASQIGVNAGAASYNDGFVPDNFTQIAAGGVPPFGQDMNGVLNETTVWDQWYQAGAPIYYDAAFAAAVNGYPQGAIVQSAVAPGDFWMSTADNNTTDPDSVSAANWVPDPSRIAPGTPVPSFSSTVPTGFVAANTLTIGNASSNATARHNADTLLAYRAIWLQFSNSACQIFTSIGAPSTRGANPDADFNANKALATPDMRGRGIMGVDSNGSSRLNFVPITLGNTTSPTSIIGENLHALNASENGPHTHVNSLIDPGHPHPFSAVLAGGATLAGNQAPSVANNSNSGSNTSASLTGITISNASSGAGTPHNTVQQSMTVFWNIKL